MTHPTHQHRRRKNSTAIAAIIACLSLGLTACAGSGEPDPIPETDPTSSTSEAAPTETTTTAPAWEDKYSTHASQRTRPPWTGGLRTRPRPSPSGREAKRLQRQRTSSRSTGSIPCGALCPSATSDLRVGRGQERRAPNLLWSKANKINANKDGTGSVVIAQCVDYTSVSTTQYGEPVEVDKAFKKPVMRTIDLGRSKGYPWLIQDLNEPTAKNYKRCSGEDQQ